MGDEGVVWCFSILVTGFLLVTAYLYLKLQRRQQQQRQQQQRPQQPQQSPPVVSPEKHSSASVCQDDATDKKQQQQPVCDEKSASSGDRKLERWPIEEQSPPCVAKNTRKNSATDTIHDPLDYCGHIQREIKRTKHRLAMEKIEAEMTEEQKEEERQAQRRQLEEIFKLMQTHKEEFGISSVDEIQEQVKLYMQA